MFSRLLPTLHATALSALISLGADGQEKPVTAAIDVEDPVISLEFKGGPFPAFVDAIHRAIDVHYKNSGANILLPPKASEVFVPRISLRGVSVSTALDAATDLTDPPNSVSIKRRGARFGLPVFSVRVKLPRKKRNSRSPEIRVVRVYSFRLLTDAPVSRPTDVKLTSKTILTAIETGLEFTGGPEAKLKYHVDSSLLFVLGTHEQTNMIESVIARLEGDVSRLRQVAVRTKFRAQQAQQQGQKQSQKAKDAKKEKSEASNNGRRAR